MKYTAEKYVDQYLKSRYNEVLSESKKRYDSKLENELSKLDKLIGYIQSHEFLLEDRTIEEWNTFVKSIA